MKLVERLGHFLQPAVANELCDGGIVPGIPEGPALQGLFDEVLVFALGKRIHHGWQAGMTGLVQNGPLPSDTGPWRHVNMEFSGSLLGQIAFDEGRETIFVRWIFLVDRALFRGRNLSFRRQERRQSGTKDDYRDGLVSPVKVTPPIASYPGALAKQGAELVSSLEARGGTGIPACGRGLFRKNPAAFLAV